MIQQVKKSSVVKKQCPFCLQAVNYISYRDVAVLTKFQSEGGRIIPRRITDICQRHQKMLAKAIKRARNLALVK